MKTHLGIGSALLWAALVPATIRAQVAFRTEVHPGKPAFTSDEQVKITFSMQNESNLDLQVLSWDLPFLGVSNDLFEVFQAGKRVPYIGVLAKRPAPKEDDFIRIHPGETFDVDLDLSKYYDIRRKGAYTVRFKKSISYRDLSGRAFKYDDSEEPVRFAASQSPDAGFSLRSDRSPPPRTGLQLKTGSKVGCSATQSNDIDAAWDASLAMAQGANLSLSRTLAALRNNAPRYSYWFGSYDATRYNTVTTHFNNIFNALANQSMVFDCSTCPGTPDADAFAYVYAGSPYRIYLCNSFWTAPILGTDSKSGTLIHETSHFTVVAGTGDYAYTQTNAHNLAGTNTTQAIANADSHEYFAEDVSHRTMPAEGMGIMMLPAIF